MPQEDTKQNPWEGMDEGMNQPAFAERFRGPTGPLGNDSCRPPFPGRPPHIPCLLAECVENILPSDMRRQDGKYDGFYADCTFGRGGHSRGILGKLSPNARLFAFDVDPEAV